MDVNQLINRVKNLQYWEVTIPVPPLVKFSGRVPFTVKIVDDRAVCKVLAVDIVEAERRVLEYFNSQV